MNQQNYLIPLLPGKVYHLFNHAVGSENLFRTNDNFVYFINKYIKYIQPVCRTFTYALMPNHFHFMVQVRSEPALSVISKKKLIAQADYADFVMQQFSNLCNAYAKAYNKMYDRKGALFVDYMQRALVESAVYFRHLVMYHHFNPVHHDFCDTPLDYRFTSYSALLSDQPTILEREIVLSRFGGKEAFIAEHQGFNWHLSDDLELDM